MKLRDAYVCLDCDELVSRGTELCPCLSGSLVPLTLWIDSLKPSRGDDRELLDVAASLVGLYRAVE